LKGWASRNAKGFADADAEATGKLGSRIGCIIACFLQLEDVSN